MMLILIVQWFDLYSTSDYMAQFSVFYLPCLEFICLSNLWSLIWLSCTIPIEGVQSFCADNETVLLEVHIW